jgi:hypothetical protein
MPTVRQSNVKSWNFHRKPQWVVWNSTAIRALLLGVAAVSSDMQHQNNLGSDPSDALVDELFYWSIMEAKLARYSVLLLLY